MHVIYRVIFQATFSFRTIFYIAEMVLKIVIAFRKYKLSFSQQDIYFLHDYIFFIRMRK